LASFGEQLRQAREARQITLQEISAATKIGRRSLQALEEEQFDRLPGGIFNKGFVRAYARYVGLDEEKTVEQYLAASGTEEPPDEEVQPPELPAEPGGKGLALLERMLKSRALSGIVLIRVLAVIVGLALGWLWWTEHKREAQRRPPVQPVGTAAARAPAAPGVSPQESAENIEEQSATQEPSSNAATTKPHPVQTPAPPAQNQAQAETRPVAANEQTQSAEGPETLDATAPVQVTIAATQKSWVRVFSDNKEIETLTMDPDKPEMSHRSYSATKRLKVVTGYPEGLTVTYNGKPAGELGRDGQPVTIIFTPSGMKTFLAKGP
jgi:cytoskeleton protein RodZ